MMIEYRKGNAVDALIHGEVDVLMHCCNAQGVMGSGIAKEIKDRIPEVFEVYKRSGHKLGTCSKVKFGKGYVVNLVAQEHYGREKGRRYVSYKALIQSLQRMMSSLKPHGARIGIPYKMCSDRAGGDWDTVLEIADAIVREGNTIVVYKLGDN